MEQDFDPYPNFPKVGSEDFEKMRQFLLDKTIPSFGSSLGPGRYSDMGLFTVASRDVFKRREEGSFVLWASVLLRFDPDDYRLWISNDGFLEVQAEKGASVKPGQARRMMIAPSNIWFAQSDESWLARRVVDTKTGYICMPYTDIRRELPSFVLMQGQRISLEEYLKVNIRGALDGQRPQILTKLPFAKIPKDYYDHQLGTVLLSHSSNVDFNHPEYEDLVVIDTESRKLVPRIVDRPLDPDKWK